MAHSSDKIPELQLILRILNPSCELNKASTETGELDWAYIVRTLADCRLAGLAYWRLSESDVTCPKKALGELEEHFTVNKFRNVMFLDGVDRIDKALESAGIKALFLKGITLLGSPYPLGARKLGDIDLRVMSEDSQGAVDGLEKAGFRLTKPLEPGKMNADMYYDMAGQPMPVDISWRYMHRAFDDIGGSDQEDRWGVGITKKKIASREVFVPDETEQMIYLASHISLHHDMCFATGLADICMIISRTKGLDAERLEKRARQLGLFNSVSVVFGLIHELYGTEVSSGLTKNWRRIKKSIFSSPAVLFFDIHWILGDETHSIIRTKEKGILRSLARLGWRIHLSDTYMSKLHACLRIIEPTRKRIDKMYRPKNPLTRVLFTLIHIPTALIITVGVLTFSVLCRPFMRRHYMRKYADRLVGATKSGIITAE